MNKQTIKNLAFAVWCHMFEGRRVCEATSVAIYLASESFISSREGDPGNYEQAAILCARSVPPTYEEVAPLAYVYWSGDDEDMQASEGPEFWWFRAVADVQKGRSNA